MKGSEANWCCEGMQLAFESRRGRGIFVYCEPDNNLIKCGPTFWLGMHSIDLDDVERFVEERSGMAIEPEERPLPVSLSTWRRIRFCPWCGKKLERFYRKHFMLLADDELSKEHKWNQFEQEH